MHSHSHTSSTERDPYGRRSCEARIAAAKNTSNSSPPPKNISVSPETTISHGVSEVPHTNTGSSGSEGVGSTGTEGVGSGVGVGSITGGSSTGGSCDDRAFICHDSCQPFHDGYLIGLRLDAAPFAEGAASFVQEAVARTPASVNVARLLRVKICTASVTTSPPPSPCAAIS